jgi:thiamine monophosphate kinase
MRAAGLITMGGASSSSPPPKSLAAMWHTSDGDRTLVGAEAALIRAAVADMSDSLRDEADGLAEEYTCGVKLVDELSCPRGKCTSRSQGAGSRPLRRE